MNAFSAQRRRRRILAVSISLIAGALALAGPAPAGASDRCFPTGTAAAVSARYQAAAPDGSAMESEGLAIAAQAQSAGTFETVATVTSLDESAFRHGWYFDCESGDFAARGFPGGPMASGELVLADPAADASVHDATGAASGGAPVAGPGDVTGARLAWRDGTITAQITVPGGAAPDSPDWREGLTVAGWELDADGDKLADHIAYLLFDAAAGRVAAPVMSSTGGQARCAAIASHSPGSDPRVYSVSFPESCLGNPASVRFRAFLAYDNHHGASPARTCAAGCTYDEVPHGGLSATALTEAVPPTPVPPTQPPADVPVERAAVRSGYWMVGEDGRVYAFGEAVNYGQPTGSLGGARATDLEPTPSGNGYWVVDDRGRVFAYGDALHRGEIPAGTLRVGEQATSLSATPSGGGYWIFTTAGRVLPFGVGAGFLGDTSQVRLNAPVLDSIATPSGKGYYMVAADGGIFTFGDALFRGSMGDRKLNAPVQSLVPDGDGQGYWLVASDGGIFTFDAPFKGSMGSVRLNRPVTGMVRFGDGYLMVAEDGGIFSFSDRPFHGSLGADPPDRPVVSVAPLGG